MNNPIENNPLDYPYNFDDYNEEEDCEGCGHDEQLEFDL
jgi:hypothetical protein